MSELVQQIKTLLAERREHEEAIVVIDQQLDDVRRMLSSIGVSAPQPKIRRQRQPWTGDNNSLTESLVLSALAQREPQTVEELSAISTTVRTLLPHMVYRGVLCRRKLDAGGAGRKKFAYARTEAGFGNQPDPAAEEEAAAALEAATG